MPLTKADIRDTTLLIQVGNIAAARRILCSSNDPRAVELLQKFDKRFPPESSTSPTLTDDLTEIKRLVAQKKFDEAEILLQASQHPDAERMLKKIAQMKSQHPSDTSSAKRAQASRLKSILQRVTGIFTSA